MSDVDRYRAALLAGIARADVRRLLLHATDPADDRLRAACQAFLASTAVETDR